MADPPERGGGLGILGVLQPGCARVPDQVLQNFGIMNHGGLGPGQLDPQGGGLGKVRVPVGVDRGHLDRIRQFDPVEAQSELQRGYHGGGGRSDVVKAAHQGAGRLGDAGQPQGEFGDDTKRALGAYKQVCQVVTCR